MRGIEEYMGNQKDPLAEGPKSAENQPQTPQGLTFTPDQAQALLTIMMMREQRLAMQEQQAAEAKETREKQRQKNSANMDAKDLLRQARCSHLKGGRKGPRSQVRDYAIYLHTFVNAEVQIKCFICKMYWKMRDTAEFLFRNGKKVANHTKIGWAEAAKMLEQTTNTPSSSEVPLQASPLAQLAHDPGVAA